MIKRDFVFCSVPLRPFGQNASSMMTRPNSPSAGGTRNMISCAANTTSASRAAAFWRLIMARVIERTVDGFSAAPGFAACGFLDDGTDLFRRLDCRQIEAHRLGGVELGCLASLPDRDMTPSGIFSRASSASLCVLTSLRTRWGRPLRLASGMYWPATASPQLIRLADAGRDLDGVVRWLQRQA